MCRDHGFELFAGTEPLDEPRYAELARAVVERRALTRASDGMGTDVDLSLVMSGFDFEAIWPSRRVFEVDVIAIPVARLSHIVESKARAGSEKDRLFLATHREALGRMLPDDDPGTCHGQLRLLYIERWAPRDGAPIIVTGEKDGSLPYSFIPPLGERRTSTGSGQGAAVSAAEIITGRASD